MTIWTRALQGIFFLAFATFSPSSLALTPSDGKAIKLSGDFAVSGGQATYSLPISVNPGRAGHQPNISLEYRSDSPNGLLGMGWSIGGLSAITRCGMNIEKDGRWGGVNFNADDRYCLDGKRLIAVSGGDGLNLTEYRLETNGYSKIISYGNAGSGPAYFKVWRTDGFVYEYGTTSDSRVELSNQSHVYKWSLAKITDDSKANNINFVYSEDSNLGKHKLAQIDYIGGKISFVYEGRSDSTFQYLGGSRLTQLERLKEIRTFDNAGVKTGTYDLTYQYSSTSLRSQLSKVNYCVGGLCSTDLQFEWSSEQSSKYQWGAPSANQYSNTAKLDEVYAKKHDPNRDGLFDTYGLQSVNLPVECIYQPDGGWKHKLPSGGISGYVGSNSTLIGSEGSPGLAFSGTKHIDVGDCRRGNHTKWQPVDDGKQIASYKNSDGIYVQYDPYTYVTGDFNGDGKITLKRKNTYSDERILYARDFDNDGKDDLVSSRTTPNWIYYYIRLSSQSFAKQTLSFLPSVQGQLEIVDINNDGLLDFAFTDRNKTTVEYYYFDGNNFKLGGKLEGLLGDISSQILFHDINRDGYLDLVVKKKQKIAGTNTWSRNVSTYRNDHGKLSNTSISVDGNAIFKHLNYLDLNSDGIYDLFTIAANSAPNNIPEILFGKATLSKPSASDKIVRFSELGIDYTVSYKHLADRTVHTQELYTSGDIKNVTPTRYVVSEVVKDPKGYSSSKTQYHYTGAKAHLRGGGFLGFRTIKETTLSDVNTELTSTYEQIDLPQSGQLLSTTIKKNGKLVVQNQYRYKTVTRNGIEAKYYQVYADKVDKKTYDLSNQQLAKRTETTTIIRDEFGNIVEKQQIVGSELDSIAGQFTTVDRFEYLSSGVKQKVNIYHIANADASQPQGINLSNYQFGVSKYCSTSGKVYFKPNDHIVLIHSEVNIPIVLKTFDNYYEYQSTSHTVDLNGLIRHQGSLISASKAQLELDNAKACGYYSVQDTDGNGSLDISGSTQSISEFVSKSGSDYWKVSAVKNKTSIISDTSLLQSGLSKTVATEYTYQSNGLLTSSKTVSSDYDTGAINSSNKVLTQKFAYDNWGNLVRSARSGTDLAERVEHSAYDSQGLYLKSQTNGLGHTTQFSYNNRGLLTQTIGALKARTVSLTYDAFARPTSETLPGINNTNHTSYKLANQCYLATPQTVSCVNTSAGTGQKTITHFDYAGREVRSLHTGFNGKWVVRDTQWDRNGRKTSVTRPKFTSDTGPSAVVTFEYDELDRERKKTEPASGGGTAAFTTSYHGYKTTVVDARGFEHSTQTNVLGHILRKDEPLGAYQTYEYYPDGKLRSSTDSAGNVTQIRYDSLGHRTYLDDPDMGQWHYRYNAAGELVYKRDANNVITSIEYDVLGRKTKQTEGNNVSLWRYDERGALGTLSGFSGNGSSTEYYYNTSGLQEEVAVEVGGETFSTYYFYDGFERVTREVRPNGSVTSLSGIVEQLNASNPANRLAIEYVYNPQGYVSAVRSPKNYADDVFTSTKFRDDIRQLLNQAIAQAQAYLTKAERYAHQESFFNQKAKEYEKETVNIHNLDASSLALLGNGYRFKQWCNDQGECYLRPGAWVLLHDEVSVPLDVTLDGAIYRLTTRLANHSTPGTRAFDTSVHTVTAAEFNGQALKPVHDFYLTDYDGNGQKDLMSPDDIYVATADGETKEELLFAADDLVKAGEVASTRYKFYLDLANELVNLSEEVAKLSGLYCEFANQLGGSQLSASARTHCANDIQNGQADHLNLILTQSELADSVNNPAYVYYWQRRETDAYDHTLSETLGNGLANTYIHDQATGRPGYITTHKANKLFNTKLAGFDTANRNLRMLRYKYDKHNNVTERYDEHLGITDTWTYDALDRVTANNVVLRDPAQHGINNADLNGPFVYQYDKLGNIISKTGIGSYTYGQQAGPHAVTSANGLSYQYDSVGNMVKAYGSDPAQPERVLEWTAFNKPSKITRNGKTVEFFYDANHTRYLKKNSDGQETFYFGKTYERVTDTNTGEVQHKHFVYADGKLIALNTHTIDANKALKDKQIRYLHYDALNSVDMITDGYGLIVERRSYDTWGKQRKVVWEDPSPTNVIQKAITNRGYTGHEEIVEVGLVHMNGRVYDQDLGRFISADPIVQAPFVTNSFNRYAYVMNNPLKYTDPTGYMYDNREVCSVDSEGDSLGSSESGSWNRRSNGCESTARRKRDFSTTGDNNRRDASVKSNSVFDDLDESEVTQLTDEEYADYSGGRFVPGGDSSKYGYIETIVQDETVAQSLRTDVELYSKSIPDTTATDVISAAGNVAATLPGAGTLVKVGAVGVEVALKSGETVRLVDTQYTRVTYKVMRARAVQYEDGTIVVKSENIDTGRRVSYDFRTKTGEPYDINVRDYQRINTGVNEAPFTILSPPSRK